MHAQLSEVHVRHSWIEGDNLDMAHPSPWREGHALAESNLAAIWGNYQAIGHSRLIYTNTASVLGDVMVALVAALGDDVEAHAFLLTSSDEEADRRLAQREIGSGLAWHSKRSREAAEELDQLAPPAVTRVNTDSRSPVEIAARIINFIGWRPI